MSVASNALLGGARGRRFLLAFALECERALADDDDDGGEPRLGAAVMVAASHLDPGRGTARVMFGPGAREVERSIVTPAVVASVLEETPLVEPEPGILLRSFVEAVDAARYWQEPDGEDRLAATAVVRDALARVADHVAGAADVSWWTDAIARGDQHTVAWEDAALARDQVSAAGRLARWRADVGQQEERARRERPTDPTASWSGEWWSIPPHGLLCTTRCLAGYGPLGLWLVEDALGWDRASTRAVTVPDGARVFEVDGADAWAELCRAHPVEVTAMKRHDWFRVTGRDGRWIVPDWPDIAREYDAIHLTAAAYLTAAGTPIHVDERTESLIAGWSPDETYWLSVAPVAAAMASQWSRDDTGWTRRSA